MFALTGQHHEHRPGRSAAWASRCARSSRTSAAAFRTAHVQGGADRRTFRRLHSRGHARPARRATTSLIAVGSIMGSGGMIVMDDTSCMVNVARFFIEFCMTESCGKCIPCRAGTAQMYTLLTRICDGTATHGRSGAA